MVQLEVGIVNMSDLKRPSLEQARMQAIPIEYRGKSLGSLVPVGSWILEDPNLIQQMSEWRGSAMRMFLIQFESTPSKTKAYLTNYSIGQRNRILFMIETGGSFVGHIGLAGITTNSAELDNLMRGSAGGSPDLMKASEWTLANWAFNELGIQSLNLRILSYNIFAKVIHEEMGFQKTQCLNLRRVVEDDTIKLTECSEEQSNVRFTCDYMTLSRQDFCN